VFRRGGIIPIVISSLAQWLQSSPADADLRDADVSGCHVYGVSAGARTRRHETAKLGRHAYGRGGVTVDNIEVAQFV
jgi:hypothetical protein